MLQDLQYSPLCTSKTKIAFSENTGPLKKKNPGRGGEGGEPSQILGHLN